MSVWWQQLVLVMCGGAVGAAGRFWLGGVLLRRLGDGFPWGTLAANLVGAFLAGFIAVWLDWPRADGAVLARLPDRGRARWADDVFGADARMPALRAFASQRAMLAYLTVSLVSGLGLVWLGARGAGLLRGPV
jgi:CrcB protein